MQHKHFLFILSVLFLVLLWLHTFGQTPVSKTAESQVIILSEARVAHILHGDHTGGGHRHGAGKPCKSEFPKGWADEKIISVTRRIAANDNLDWERQDNGYYVAETFEGRTKVRVVLGREKKRVITSYPVNVPRNPCTF